MLERYFGQPDDKLLLDARPESHYQAGSQGMRGRFGCTVNNPLSCLQIGLTPEMVEVPRCSSDPKCLAEIEKQVCAQ